MSSLRRHPMIDATFKTRDVREKTAVMGPNTAASLRERFATHGDNDFHIQPNQFTGGPPVDHFQGMPVQVRNDVPDDKIYILEGRMHQQAIYEPQPAVTMGMVDEYHHTGPLELLDAEIEAVCRRAR